MSSWARKSSGSRAPILTHPCANGNRKMSLNVPRARRPGKAGPKDFQRRTRSASLSGTDGGIAKRSPVRNSTRADGETDADRRRAISRARAEEPVFERDPSDVGQVARIDLQHSRPRL